MSTRSWLKVQGADNGAVADVALHALHLCSGYGGFELALRHAGIDARTVCHVERDTHAAATLVARMDDEALDRAPIWDDLVTFDGAAWRGRVDVVTAGFPCQPFSAAGQQRGVDDDRWLWPDIARIVADVGPRYVILENVTGLIRHGLPHVLADLARLGFDAEWGCLSAAAVGASHKRERFWLLAYACGEGRPEVAGSAPSDESADGWWSHSDHVLDGHGEAMADIDRSGWKRKARAERAVPELDDERRELVDAGCIDDATWGLPFATGAPHSGFTYRGFPPSPDDLDGWRQWVETGGPKPVVCRDSDGAPHRLDRPGALADRLHLAGNGLVPQCAAEALRQLIERSLS